VRFDLLIHNASQVITCSGNPRGAAELALARVPQGAVGVQDGKVAWVGPELLVPAAAVTPQTVIVDAEQGFVGPGFVDPHTHLVFAGDRAGEFARRCAGESYLDIARSGGGIVATVMATRRATEDELVSLALPRLKRLAEHGVTTVEIKSGYGLDLENELKILRVVKRLQSLQPLRIVPTLMCAHAVPPEFNLNRAAYLKLCGEDILNAVHQQGLAQTYDIFVEETAFTPSEARDLAKKAQALGFKVRLHVDQLSMGMGGAELAAELHAITADHLEQITGGGIQALAEAGTVAVLAPTSTLFARARPYAPGRALRDAGVAVALCTNLNPGSSNSENLPLAMGLACLENGLTTSEAYLGFTRSAALALSLEDAGRIEVGLTADLVLFKCPSPDHLPWHLGMNEVRSVYRAGRKIAGAGGAD
jgi:imidazolonepropionase